MGKSSGYNQGTAEDQKLFYQHDAHWIGFGLSPSDPDFGKIAIFNNRLEGDVSTVNFIAPIFDEYELNYPIDGNIYGPADFSFTYSSEVPTDMFSSGLSGSQKLPNGNLLVCVGRQGRSFEVKPDGTVVWEYVTPLQGGSPVAQGTELSINSNLTFRMTRYMPDFAAFENNEFEPSAPIEINPEILWCTSLSTEELANQSFSVFPNPSEGRITIKGIQPINIVRVSNALGQILVEKSMNNNEELDLSMLNNGVYVISINGTAAQRIIIEK